VCLAQDLSLGRLRCEPDEIYVPTLFAVRDLTDLLPASLEAQARCRSGSTQSHSPVMRIQRRMAFWHAVKCNPHFL
jgi:hypothetical protein